MSKVNKIPVYFARIIETVFSHNFESDKRSWML